jgi:hypothetical protein
VDDDTSVAVGKGGCVYMGWLALEVTIFVATFRLGVAYEQVQIYLYSTILRAATVRARERKKL